MLGIVSIASYNGTIIISVLSMKLDHLTLMQQAQIRHFELTAEKLEKEQLIKIVLKLMVLLFNLTNLITLVAGKGVNSEKP
jgi:hypothetical protein